MSDASVRKHPYHIIDPSPWPFVGSVGALILAIGAVNYFHGGAPWIMLAGFAVVLFTMFGWWRDVIKESIRDRAHTGPVSFGLRAGMVLFIVSEVMFFAAFFWAYFHSALLYNPVIENSWPPPGIELIDAWGLPFINTVILVTSSFVLMWAHKQLKANNRKPFLIGLGITILMGATFLVLQILEYGHATFAFTDGIYPSVFYMTTGFHGFHVFVGVCTLAVMFFRGLSGQLTPDKHIGFQAADWYWHFVDVVWLFLFVFFYVWVGLTGSPSI
jgi:cytochrome c oxidase subunit 3